MEQIRAWAEETFGGADLRDRRRTRRLVDMASAAAVRPGGAVTFVMTTPAEKEGAFRLLENRQLDAFNVTDAMGAATATQCADRLVYVAVDQTDLTFVDRKGVRGLGPDSSRKCASLRCTQVMNALALDSDGVPLGLLDQQWWLRSESKSPHWKEDKRPAEERESYNWVRSVEACDERLRQSGQDCQACYVCDRGADIATFLSRSLEQRRLFIVRAAQNRIVQDHRSRKRKLFSMLQRQPVVGISSIEIPRGPNRRARTARCEVRIQPAARVQLGKQQHELAVVSVREVGYVPDRQERIQWRLLTNMPVTDYKSAKKVINAYRLRWRVEEFHRTWKSGGCNVERSQLRSFAAIKCWATILAAVATRIERLKRLSRETPDVDALTEISQAELDVSIAITEDKRHKLGDRVTLKEGVRLIAMVGGYMGRRGDGPPGSITIGRGLDRLGPAVKAYKILTRSG